MRPSYLMALGAATLSGFTTASRFPRLAPGCENADCSSVPAPKVVRGIMSVRDDRCQYSCHVRNVRDRAQRQEQAMAADSAAEVPVAEAGEDGWAGAGAATQRSAPDLGLDSGAFAAILAAQHQRGKRADAVEEQQVPVGQFDVSVTNIPRRSEGLCKFAMDIIDTPGTVGASIMCPGGGVALMEGMTRATAALFAARLAVEYDASCAISDATSYHVVDSPEDSILVFSPDDNVESRTAVVGTKTEVFFLNCGAVFLSRPTMGFSGTYVSAQVRMLRDSRGLIPVMAEFFPPSVFGEKSLRDDYSAKNPPAWLKEAVAEV
ncbi:hypothetical protein A9K55_003820 [Cordyceps militaris]|uniref:Uncharacterized protein n=1 Tax=Cordyceps militaris TaxID=73501 RepID=A0A2H4SMA4_CORMI|nr:hypothetical protein A9K55_003820 [Cordyceps militaris]